MTAHTETRRCHYDGGPLNGQAVDLPTWVDELTVPLNDDLKTVAKVDHLGPLDEGPLYMAMYDRLGDLLLYRGVGKA